MSYEVNNKSFSYAVIIFSKLFIKHFFFRNIGSFQELKKFLYNPGLDLDNKSDCEITSDYCNNGGV